MPSYENYEFKYKKPNGKKNANDITIVFTTQVEVLGVDGVSPSDPKAGFSLEGDGTAQLKIRKIDKGDGETLELRIKTRGAKLPPPPKAAWTIDGKTVSNALELVSRFAIDDELDPVLASFDALEPVLIEMRDLAERIRQASRSPLQGGPSALG